MMIQFSDHGEVIDNSLKSPGKKKGGADQSPGKKKGGADQSPSKKIVVAGQIMPKATVPPNDDTISDHGEVVGNSLKSPGKKKGGADQRDTGRGSKDDDTYVRKSDRDSRKEDTEYYSRKGTNKIEEEEEYYVKKGESQSARDTEVNKKSIQKGKEPKVGDDAASSKLSINQNSPAKKGISLTDRNKKGTGGALGNQEAGLVESIVISSMDRKTLQEEQQIEKQVGALLSPEGPTRKIKGTEKAKDWTAADLPKVQSREVESEWIERRPKQTYSTSTDVRRERNSSLPGFFSY